jgi:hypothetical protein
MHPAVPGAFHHFVGATKEALTTAKILLRGKAVVGVLFLSGPTEVTGQLYEAAAKTAHLANGRSPGGNNS